MTINPHSPCPFPRGSPQRLAMYQARDRAGIPLWNPLDSMEAMPRLDNGPAESKGPGIKLCRAGVAVPVE